MTLYMGVDFHPHQQTVCWMDTETGELRIDDLRNEPELVREFYQGKPPSVIGIEASLRAGWYEDLIFECGHELVTGDPALIRKRAVSRHKSDHLDAEHIYMLLLRGEFPALWRRPRASVNILEIIGLRAALVRQRTQVYNRVQRMAHECGLRKGRMGTLSFQKLVKELDLNEAQALRREHLLRQMESLNVQIGELDPWLEQRAAEDESALLLMTQAGVGYLTALALTHTLGDVRRFATTRQVTAYLGLDPVERSSGSQTRFGRISKAGSSLARHLLGQAANIATRRDPRLKGFYRRLVKKKPKAVAKTAAARKLAVKLSIMLRDRLTALEFDQRGAQTVDRSRATTGPEMAVI